MTPRRRLRMKVERHKVAPGELSPLRKLDVTASVVGALAGLHPYETPMGLFASKTGVLMPDDEDTSAMRRGRLLEDAVARAFLEEHPGWKVSKARVYLRAPMLRLGATPDFFVVDDKGRKGVLQAKTVSGHVFKRNWTDETPPTWIALQCLTEAMLSRAEFGMTAALEIDSYHFRLHCYEVPRHEAAERRIQDMVANFWADVAAGRAPTIDYARDASLLPVLYPRHVEGKIADLRADNALPALLDEREQLHEQLKSLGDRKDAIETELKFKMTDAEVALVAGWRITNREQHRKEHMVKAADFRVLRITREKESQQRKAFGER